jgi:hypothetical protein
MRAVVVFMVLVPLSLLSLVGCSQDPPSPPRMAPADAASNGAKCALHLTGNTSAELSSPSCGELGFSAGDGGAAEIGLSFHWSTATLRALDVAIALGAAPTVGDYSSQTLREWSALGVTRSGCEYVAGSESVPRGSFKLTLSSLEIVAAGEQTGVDSGADATADGQADSGSGSDADLDAGSTGDADSSADGGRHRHAGIAHGRLELTLAVHAPPATDCGPFEIEDLTVDF